MKKLFALMLLSLFTLPLFAADLGSIYLNYQTPFTVVQGTTSYADQMEFTTAADGAPVTILVHGSLSIYAGSGRGAGYHSEYDLLHVTSVSVTDANGNAICAPTLTLINTGRAAPINQYEAWTCTAASVPLGTYTITFSGTLYSAGNMTATSGRGVVLVSAPLAPPPEVNN